MFAYHFTWDLAHFGFIAAGAPFSPGFRLFSHAIASTFLFLAGVSLVLARREPFEWTRYFVHLARIAAAAGLVTAASAILFPSGLIFFGILHCIVLAIALATPCLFLPPIAALMAAAIVALMPFVLRSTLFDHPALLWVGLGTFAPTSNDYRPFFPWAAPTLLGMGVALLAARRRVSQPPQSGQPWATLRLLRFGGRHSLAIYLLHQPVFFAMLWLAASLFPPQPAAADIGFTTHCETACRGSGGRSEACRRSCGCAARDMRALGLWDKLAANTLDPAERTILSGVVQDCLRRGP